MKLTFYQVGDKAPKVVASPRRRQWMEETHQRYAYRCLPLTIANAMGWQILSPCRVMIEWHGGDSQDDLKVYCDYRWRSFVLSHFGHGIVTFAVGYLLRTDPGVGTWVRGAPNQPKDGIVALDGIVETDWLPFPFTMNWRFTRPGLVTFEAGEPICFVTPFRYRELEEAQPEIMPLSANPELQKEHQEWVNERKDFNKKLFAQDEETVKQGWTRYYMQGKRMDGEGGNPLHLTNAALKEPKVNK